ncbi:MAG TPA: hypothetical protein VGM33_17005 [Baekduia sp.]
MGRRLITVLLACAATAAVAPLSAGAQEPSTGTPAAAVPGASTAVPATTGVPASTAVPATPAPASAAAPANVSPQTSGQASDDDSSLPVILVALVGLLLLLTAAVWGAARWWAAEPTWWLNARHSTAEAGWRTSAAWAEFRDWLRLGR